MKKKEKNNPMISMDLKSILRNRLLRNTYASAAKR